MTDFTLDYWQEKDGYVGKLRELPNCFSQGETLQELEENIKEVYALLCADQLPTPVHAHTKILPLAA